MPTYRFRLIATDGVIQSPGTTDADCDDAACEVATELLLDSDYPVIEVWQAGAMIYRLSKVDPSETRSPAVGAESTK